MKKLTEIQNWQELINEVVQGDCLEGMKLLPDKCIDLIVTDPPYGMQYQSSWRTDKFDFIALDNNLEWVDGLLQQAFRVLKEDSHIYLFCNEYSIAALRKGLIEKGFKTKRMLVWVKNNHTSGDLEGDFGNKTEYILFAHKGRKELNGNRDTNVLLFDRVSDLKHPTQKPEDLMSYLISKSSQRGDLALDPFMGSWTTARACKDLGRNFIGFELEEKYCRVGEKRLRQEVLF